MQFPDELLTLADKAQRALCDEFAYIDRVAQENTARVMQASPFLR